MGTNLKLIGVTWWFFIIGLSQGLPVTQKTPAPPPEMVTENLAVCWLKYYFNIPKSCQYKSESNIYWFNVL